MTDSYYAVQFKSELTNKWLTEEKYFLSSYNNSQIALNLAIENCNRESLYCEFEKRVVLITEEIVYIPHKKEE